MTAPLDRARLREAALRYNQQFGPDTVLALLDALDAAERERDAVRAANVDCVLHFDDVKAERDALAALLQRARTALADMDRACDRDLIDAIDALDGAKGK